jgi:hypothetical protein
MSSRHMSLLPRAPLHSGSEHYLNSEVEYSALVQERVFIHTTEISTREKKALQYVI